MPIFTAPSQCYMLPSGFYVVGEVGRGEILSTLPGALGYFSDSDMVDLVSDMNSDSTGIIYMAIQNGRFLLLSTDEADTHSEQLQIFQAAADSQVLHTNWVDATWPAGATPYTVTAAEPLQFTETDRENFEVAIGKAIQQTGLYYDVDSVTRWANTLTVTLDESQKPYDAGWDSVLALVADWFGGEMP